MDEFLTNRYEVVERISSIRSAQEKLNSNCILCESIHNLRFCPKFRRLTTRARMDLVFKNKICNNCLSSSHTKSNCLSKNTCLQCKKSHHSLLHINSYSKKSNGVQSSTASSPNYNPNSLLNSTAGSTQPATMQEDPLHHPKSFHLKFRPIFRLTMTLFFSEPP